MKLIKKWNEFEKTINEFKVKAETILNSFKSSNNQDDFVKLQGEFKIWQSQVVDFLTISFDNEENEFTQAIRYPQINSFDIGNRQKDTRQLIKEKCEVLSNLSKNLAYWLRILSISDAIVRPDEINLEERENYSTDEILELLLEKLYLLYDDYFHPISAILHGNRINLNRHGEERELAKTLENYGFVKLLQTRDVCAQLTIEGKRYVEKNLRKQTTDYSKIDKSQEELNQKIDEIIETLNKQNLGQEILFEELEDLKELYSTLNKKNWGQILKGKLIDLALAQVINKEVMESIFKELTDQVLRLK